MRGTLLGDVWIFMTISLRTLLTTRNISDKFVEKFETFIFCYIIYFLNLASYEMMWKNVVVPDRPQMTIWRMRIACWINMATDTHSDYVILIAFPRQRWLDESVSMLRLYVNSLSCVVIFIFFTHYVFNKLIAVLWLYINYQLLCTDYYYLFIKY